TLVVLVTLATVAVPVLTEAASSASQAWSLPEAKSAMIAATRHAVLFGLLGMVVALTTLAISQGADAASYNRWNLPPGTAYNTQAIRNYGSGPLQRRATGPPAAIPIRSFADRFCASTTAAVTNPRPAPASLNVPGSLVAAAKTDTGCGAAGCCAHAPSGQAAA